MFASSDRSLVNAPAAAKVEQARLSSDLAAGTVAAWGPARPDSSLPLLATLGRSGCTLKVEKGEEIIAQDDPAQFCFQVIEGCVRSLCRMEDGRRQVSEFLLAGDIFGLDSGATHEFAAEAVTETTIRKIRLSAIEAEAEADPRFALALRRHMAMQAKTMRSRLVLLGRMTAAERTAAFLLEMNARLGCPTRGIVNLPMCRGDMADYLGLTIETVSRCLSELKRTGAISVKGAQIVVQNRRVLSPSETLH